MFYVHGASTLFRGGSLVFQKIHKWGAVTLTRVPWRWWCCPLWALQEQPQATALSDPKPNWQTFLLRNILWQEESKRQTHLSLRSRIDMFGFLVPRWHEHRSCMDIRGATGLHPLTRQFDGASKRPLVCMSKKKKKRRSWNQKRDK